MSSGGCGGGPESHAAAVLVAFVVLATWEPFAASAATATTARTYSAEIIRDPYGVPHISGKTDADTAFGVAIAHAEDDFFTLQDVVAMARIEQAFGESHADFAPAGEGKVVDLVHRNLGLLAPRFRHVVSAAQLAESARPDDLQWHTEVLDPTSFLGDAYWARLEPVSGAFRSLR